MEAKIVVGLGWGDEGKGITTDYLASNLHNNIVVRYSGGQQAGHNVVKGDVKHIFSSFGAGVLQGSPSYLSEYCCFYPPNMKREWDVLLEKGFTPKHYIHPLAKLTTPYDVAYNRLLERRLDHGSCGIGIGTTMSRNTKQYKLHAIDLSHSGILKEKLNSIKGYYDRLLWGEFNTKELKYYKEVVDVEKVFFDEAINSIQFNIVPYGILRDYDNIIFEGSQGILLDMDMGIFPNVTYANTSSKNAHVICKQLGINDIELYYITRCYQTRHGNGYMSNNDPITLINNEEEINVTNEWQGNFRIGELDYGLLQYSLACDDTYSYMYNKNLVVTCLDQRPFFNFEVGKLPYKFKSVIKSYSPDLKNFKIKHYV